MNGMKFERAIFLIHIRNWLNEDRVRPSNVNAILNPTKNSKNFQAYISGKLTICKVYFI